MSNWCHPSGCRAIKVRPRGMTHILCHVHKSDQAYYGLPSHTDLAYNALSTEKSRSLFNSLKRPGFDKGGRETVAAVIVLLAPQSIQLR